MKKKKVKLVWWFGAIGFSTLVQQALNNSVVASLPVNNVLSLELVPVKTYTASL